jgi:outer membrane cobalamin receptor
VAVPAAVAGEDPARPDGEPDAGFGETIVVTGTRIPRKDLTTPAPVTVILREQKREFGRPSVGDFLQTLPEQGNALNSQVNNGGDGSTRISLRGLGDYRTLVLLNGRRLMPGGSGADRSADLSLIPDAAIERIEVLKDGASPLYGSDAVAGVVNLLTRRGWNGLAAHFYGVHGSRSNFVEPTQRDGVARGHDEARACPAHGAPVVAQSPSTVSTTWAPRRSTAFERAAAITRV